MKKPHYLRSYAGKRPKKKTVERMKQHEKHAEKVEKTRQKAEDLLALDFNDSIEPWDNDASRNALFKRILIQMGEENVVDIKKQQLKVMFVGLAMIVLTLLAERQIENFFEYQTDPTKTQTPFPFENGPVKKVSENDELEKKAIEMQRLHIMKFMTKHREELKKLSQKDDSGEWVVSDERVQYLKGCLLKKGNLLKSHLLLSHIGFGRDLLVVQLCDFETQTL